MKVLYKVLNKNMISPFQGYKFKINHAYKCTDFDVDKNNDCSNGYYATDLDGIYYSYRKGREIWLCEVWGKEVGIDQYKRRYENIKIIKKMNINKVKYMLKELNYDWDIYGATFPKNPLYGKPKKLCNKHIFLLKEWASGWASVWASVKPSVGASVVASVWASVGVYVENSVWASVVASVKPSVVASVGAYISSLFSNIEKWEYIDHKKGVNPFKPCIDLWNMGIIPSYDGKKWRLHSGKKAEIIWEGNLED